MTIQRSLREHTHRPVSPTPPLPDTGGSSASDSTQLSRDCSMPFSYSYGIHSLIWCPRAGGSSGSVAIRRLTEP